MNAGYAKTDARVDGAKSLDARFRVKGFQQKVGTNAASPTAQLQSLRVLSVISYLWWGFVEVDFPGALLKSIHVERVINAKPPLFSDGNPGSRWKMVVKPLYGTSQRHVKNVILRLGISYLKISEEK